MGKLVFFVVKRRFYIRLSNLSGVDIEAFYSSSLSMKKIINH